MQLMAYSHTVLLLKQMYLSKMFKYLYFTEVPSFNPTFYFYFIIFKRVILCFLTHYIYLKATVGKYS